MNDELNALFVQERNSEREKGEAPEIVLDGECNVLCPGEFLNMHCSHNAERPVAAGS